MIGRLSDHFDSLHAFLDSRFIERNEVCIACRDTFGESLVDVL